ncbi:beta-ketoacyl synthase N-terminal-like domain-containing protein, partial [Burkholderia thailandensis]
GAAFAARATPPHRETEDAARHAAPRAGAGDANGARDGARAGTDANDAGNANSSNGSNPVARPPASVRCGSLDIAVVGMAGRYPGARDLDELWANLRDGRDCVTEVPAERWRADDVAHVRSPSGKPVSRWGGFIDAPDCFDARFFRITPREAEVMDPQERVFLETAWAAIEDAGHTPDTLARRAPGGGDAGA